MNIVVAGIGTEVGKTVVSAMLCSAFGLDYWKPVQAGSLEHTDSDTVRSLVPGCRVFPERYRLSEPMSPHAAAAIDGVSISMDELTAPDSSGLLIELAGGVMVPLASDLLNIDVVETLGFPVVLVASYYLGSINHTLLSIDALTSRGVSLAGLVFSGTANPQTRAVIVEYSGIEPLADVAQMPKVTRENVQTYGRELRKHPSLARL